MLVLSIPLCIGLCNHSLRWPKSGTRSTGIDRRSALLTTANILRQASSGGHKVADPGGIDTHGCSRSIIKAEHQNDPIICFQYTITSINEQLQHEFFSLSARS